MGHEYLTHQATQALQLVLYLSMPILVVATVVRLIVSLLQALTSIQEQTLPHAFKLMAIIVAISVTVNWLGPELYEFALNIFTQFPYIEKK